MIWNRDNQRLIKLAKNIYGVWLVVGNAVIPLVSLIHITLNNDHTILDRTRLISMSRYNQGKTINKFIIDSLWTTEYTPAITIVGLCKGVGIGVGADIAFDDQVGEGDWADLGK